MDKLVLIVFPAAILYFLLTVILYQIRGRANPNKHTENQMPEVTTPDLDTPKEPTAVEIVDSLHDMLDREPTREEIITALGVPLVYKDASNFVAEQYIVPYLKTQGLSTVCQAAADVAPTGQDMLLGEMFSCFAQWHHDRNLITGATDRTQFAKLLEEVVELYASLNPKANTHDLYTDMIDMMGEMLAAGRIKPATSNCILDDVGDINVVLTNLLARRGQSIGDALLAAWGDIKDRKGMMIGGTFVKEADLTDGDKEEPACVQDSKEV
jgi:hypothetical protein